MTALVLLIALASGQEAERAWGPAAQEVPPPLATPQLSERERPNYDGRATAPPSLGESLLWVPRVALAPLYAVEKFVIYPPVAHTIKFVEREGVAKKVERALTIGDPDGGHALFLPTALISFGFRASVGAALIGSDIGPEGKSSFRVAGAYGGPNWVAFGGSWRQDIGTPLERDQSAVVLEAQYLRRPDEVFAGLGNVRSVEESRYSRSRLGVRAGVDAYTGLYDHIRTSIGFQRNDFDVGQDGVIDDPSIATLYRPDRLSGFTEGYGLLDLTLEGTADSRLARPEAGTGLAGDFAATLGTDVSGQTDSFLRLSAGASAFMDVSGTQRTLKVRQWLGSIVGFSDNKTIAFTELHTLGGVERHRGFLRESLRGESAALTTFEYSWPVWVMFDANLFAEFGGVYGPNFQDLGLDNMRGSFGIGFSAIDREVPFHANIGFGTSRFGDGISFENLQFTFGTTGLN